MKMNKLVYLIENSSSEEVVEFIDEILDTERIFNEEDKVIITQGLRLLKLKKNNEYLSSIIDLMKYLEIYDDLIISKLLAQLEHSNYYCQLSFLDYIFNYNYSDDVICYLQKITKSRVRLIVRNQVLLMQLLKKSKLQIPNASGILIENMKRTKDYRAHIRYMNTIMNYPNFDTLNLDTFKTLISISKTKQFGRSVVEKTKEFEFFISSLSGIE